MAKWDLSKLEKQNYGVAQARRFYMHVQEGGTLTARDVGRMVEAMERLEAENTLLKQMWWDAGDVTDLAGTIADLEAKLAKAMEALTKIKQTYPADAHRLIHGDRQIIEIADATLAELKGQDDEGH